MMHRKPLGGNLTLQIHNLQQCRAFAELIAQVTLPGDFIALTGELGTGKTTFMQYFAKALGVTQTITSPTFTLINEYALPSGCLLHGDLYRLEEEELEMFVLDLASDMIAPHLIMCLEWADKAPSLASLWTIHLAFTPGVEADKRLIHVTMRDLERLSKVNDDDLEFAH